MPGITDHQPILCEESFVLDGTDVVIRLREPVFDPDPFWLGHVPDFRCEFEVDGLDKPVRGDARGIDTLAAVVAARRHIAYTLFPVRRKLRHPEDSSLYDSVFAYGVSLADAGRRRRIRAIIDEETYKLEQDRIAEEMMRCARAADVASKETTAVDSLAASGLNATCGGDAPDHNKDFFLTPPLAIRRLQAHGASDIEVRIWRPISVKSAGWKGYLCGFTLTGLDDRHQSIVADDSMTALFHAICAVDAYLDPHRTTLTWFGQPYPDPAFSDALDGGRRRRIHDVIEEELSSISERQREQREYQEHDSLRDRGLDATSHP